MLTTERLILRDFEESDFEAAHAYGSDAEVVRYMNWGPNTPEETRAFLRKAMGRISETPRRDFELGVAHKSNNQLIGGCGLSIDQRHHHTGNLGYCLARDRWGQGYMTEAAEAMLRFGFTQCGLHRVYATCDVRNTGSWRVMEKIGMRREAEMREDCWERGEWRSSFLYAVLEQEWRARQA